jgi:NADH-quinone oxidoreductase subunit H
MAFSQPVGFIVALIGLMGKLELPPFDAPEAETEIVAGALTEYSGRGLAMFKVGKSIELIVGITLVSSSYLGGLHGVLPFLVKTLGVLFLMSILQTLLTRLRIDQTVGMWWRFGSILVLAQILVTILLKGGLL